MKKLVLVILMALFFSVPVFALQDSEGGFDPMELVAVLNPIVVFLAIQLSKKIVAWNSTVILAVLVPGLSLLGGWLVSFIFPDTSFLLTFLLGFVSTFVYELQKQLGGDGT